ncbi:MAG: hypothetical protein LBP63_09560 [Prevotellaceae bacterium]|jgi:hypothetical protein|nr:hypothetical protein [Prevotellaceae bacterium]
MEEIIISPKKKEVETILITSLLNLVLEDGFIHRKKDNTIIRNSKTGFESFWFDVLNYWPYCEKIESVVYSIRFNQIEDIVNPILYKNGLHKVEYPKTSITICQNISFCKEIYKHEELDIFIKLYINQIKENGMSFYEKFNNINKVNIYKKGKILTDNSGLYYIESNLMQSLTLMKLCNDSDFEELVQKYKTLYSNWGGYKEKGMSAINDLIEYLSKL